MRLWLQAIFLIVSSKKGVSSNQLRRTLGMTLKSAWFMSHRIREAMKDSELEPFGSGGGIVEVDETFIGNQKGKKKVAYSHKNKVLSLVDRTTGKARSIVLDDLKLSFLLPILQANIAPEARVITDDAGQYRNLWEHLLSTDSFATPWGNTSPARIEPSVPIKRTTSQSRKSSGEHLCCRYGNASIAPLQCLFHQFRK